MINRRLKNIRDTYVYEFTNSLVRTKPGKVVIEDLNVSGMTMDRDLNVSINLM